MDEILIEEKKYVSSKQAAKITGYAKDYIGQLCREGRVPARLVGRSWYVLESAIQDHRFGNQDQMTEVKATSVEDTDSPTKIWEFPRYESVPVETLPALNRLVESEPTNDLHDSWKAWFDHTATGEQPSSERPVLSEDVNINRKEEEKEEMLGIKMEEDEVAVPLRVVTWQPSPQAVPAVEAYNDTDTHEETPSIVLQKSFVGRMFMALKIGILFIAVLSLVLAVINSGYADKYIKSFRQASILSGISTYNK